MKPEAVEIATLGSRIEASFDWLLFSISYEERSSVIWKTLAKANLRFVAFHNANHDYIKPHVENVRAVLSTCTLVPMNSDVPIDSLDQIIRGVSGTAHKGPVRVGVDITCFTRETLAMVLLVLRHSLPAGSVVTCLYTEADDYMPNKQAGENWLTRGIADIRSILGYRGTIRLLAPTHLIILSGFETERIHSIIEALNPDSLTIGRVRPEESIRPHFADTSEDISGRISSFYPDRFLRRMEFSSKDPYFTRDKLIEVTRENENTIVACLNTKVAMAGACMAAFNKPAIQLIYAQPLDYNIQNFSKVGRNVLIFPLEWPAMFELKSED